MKRGIDFGNIDWGLYIEKEFVSKRFVLALIVVIGYLLKPDTVPSDAVTMVLGFYFGSHVASITPQIVEAEPLKYETFVGSDTKGD